MLEYRKHRFNDIQNRYHLFVPLWENFTKQNSILVGKYNLLVFHWEHYLPVLDVNITIQIPIYGEGIGAKRQIDMVA